MELLHGAMFLLLIYDVKAFELRKRWKRSRVESKRPFDDVDSSGEIEGLRVARGRVSVRCVASTIYCC